MVINFRTKSFSNFSKMNARIKLLARVYSFYRFGREYFPILTGFVFKFCRNLISIFIFAFRALAIRCLEILSKFNFHFHPRISRVCVQF